MTGRYGHVELIVSDGYDATGRLRSGDDFARFVRAAVL